MMENLTCCFVCSGVEPSVHMIDPMHFDRIDHDDVVQKWYVDHVNLCWVNKYRITSDAASHFRGVSSDKLGDVLALAGDSSDNIPGVRWDYIMLYAFVIILLTLIRIRSPGLDQKLQPH